MKKVKLVTYSENGMMFEDLFENMNQLNKYVKSCGGFKQIGDYEIYTQDNKYRYNTSLKMWVMLY